MEKSDYTDPACPFDLSMWQKNAPVHAIPVGRVIEKEDAFLGKNDYAGAERLLLYWLSEAEAGNDLRGAFSVENELMGLYRKLARKEDAFRHAENALRMTEAELIGPDSVGAATCYLNAATVCKAFDEAERALPLYEKARAIYERELPDGDGRLGGLYNNMALALTDLGRFDEAISSYEKALSQMEKVENGEPERAVTYLNLCDLLMDRDAREVTDEATGETYAEVPDRTEEMIQMYLDRAEELLLQAVLPDEGYLAFVYEKCAPSFDYYGRFLFAKELRKKAKAIYERP